MGVCQVGTVEFDVDVVFVLLFLPPRARPGWGVEP